MLLRTLRAPARRITSAAYRTSRLNAFPLVTETLQRNHEFSQQNLLPATAIRTYASAGRPHPPGGTHRMDFGGEDQKSALEQYGVDLTARAKSGKLDPVIVSLIYLLVLQFIGAGWSWALQACLRSSAAPQHLKCISSAQANLRTGQRFRDSSNNTSFVTTDEEQSGTHWKCRDRKDSDSRGSSTAHCSWRRSREYKRQEGYIS